MKFLYFADLHWSGKNSENRIGDYRSDVFTKFKEILSLSKKYNCDYIISGADEFENYEISLIMTDEFIDLVEENNIPYYTIWGNHTEMNHSPELSKGTTLAHIFRRSKLIKHLDILEGDNFLIVGKDYEHNIEQELKEKGWEYPKKALSLRQNKVKLTSKWKIGIIHSFLTERPFLPQVLHITIQEINTNFDLILSGHNHTPFKKLIDETLFINSGCIGRLSIAEADIKPSVILVDTDKRTTEIIPLKSAKSKEEIFDLTKVETNKKFENEINKFIEGLQTTKFSELNILGIIEEYGKKNNIDREILDEVIKRLGTEDETK